MVAPTAAMVVARSISTVNRNRMMTFTFEGIRGERRGVASENGRQTIRRAAPVRRIVAGALLLISSGGAFAHDHAMVAGGNPLADAVRGANARFADVAVAVSEGYAPIPCVSGIEGGAMGIHYVNGTLIDDGAIDIGHPEAVMYEPRPDGTMELVAVEYIATKGPAELGGHLFSFVGAPNRYGLPAFYELHVWAWRDNPTGAFADMNPEVSCAAAPMPAQ
jgi:hypothetical protein